MHSPGAYNQWLILFKAGDPKGMEHIRNVNYFPLLNFAKKFVYTEQEAEDIVQDTFEKLWRRRENFETAINIKAFLFITTKNACLNSLIKLKRERKVFNEFMHHLDTLEYKTENPADDTELLSRIKAEIKKLPPRRQKVFILRTEGVPYKKIATLLGIQIQTARNHYKYAIHDLKKALFVIIEEPVNGK